jgi:hypothetical protein
MNSNYGTGDGNQRAWGATGAGNSSSLFLAWQTFGPFDWAQELEYLDAGLPGGNHLETAREYQNGHPPGSIRELEVSPQPIRPESMAPPPSPRPRLPDRHQAPKSNPGIPAPQKGRKRQPLESEWNKHKHKIKDLYITLDLSLKDTLERMETEHGFFAS